MKKLSETQTAAAKKKEWRSKVWEPYVEPRRFTQDNFLTSNKMIFDKVAKPPRGGACKGMDTSLFFPTPVNGSITRRELAMRAEAIAVCRTCPIRSKCLMYAIEWEPFGIWGGMTENQRRVLACFWDKVSHRVGQSGRKVTFWATKDPADYITDAQDQEFVKEVARENNLAQPSFVERGGFHTSGRRRSRQVLATPTRRRH